MLLYIKNCELDEGCTGVLCTILEPSEQIWNFILMKLPKENKDPCLEYWHNSWYMWTRKQVAPSAPSSYPPTPGEVTSSTKQVLWLEEWTDRNRAPNGIIELLNQLTLKPLSPANFVLFAKSLCPLKQLRLGARSYLGSWWTRMDWVMRQGGILPSLLGGYFSSRKFCMWIMGQFSLIPPNFSAIGLLKINKCEDTELIFT